MKKRWKRILIIDAVLLGIAALLVLSVKAPGEIRGLTVKEATYDSVVLAWDESENASAYHIYRSEKGADPEYLDSTTETTYTDGELTTGTEYKYSVRAVNGIKRTPVSEAVAVTPDLETPSVKGSARKGKVELSVSEIDGAEGYRIYRDGKLIGDLPAGKKKFADEEAEPDKTHKYKVKAYRQGAESEASNQIEFTLEPVGEMTASIEFGTLTISWEPSDYDYYRLYKDDELLAETYGLEYEMEAEAGEYVFTLVGYRGKTQSPDSVHKYLISEEDMDNAEAIDEACAWAEKIASDDSFMYGTGERAHRTGCYFCGTNLKKKGSGKVKGHSYEKTYCCNPFVHAAYAHGAGDPTMLEACRAGESVGMTVKSYTRYGNWVKVGKPARGNLRKGDVLIANPNMGSSESNHVMLYIGGGYIAHAARSGWDNDSIRVNKLSAGNYRRCDFVMRYTGNGRGSKLVITEVEDDKNGTETAPDKTGNEKGTV